MAPSWSPTLKALNPTIPIADNLANEPRLLIDLRQADLRSAGRGYDPRSL